MRLSLRQISLFGILVCVAALFGAVLMDHMYLLSPCPLCMLQRIVFVGLAILFFAGVIFNFQSALRYVYAVLIFFMSALGFAIASWQFWLQYFAPPQHTSCSASLQRLIELYPVFDALKMIFAGSPECAKVDFTIFYISLAGWSVFIFGTFMILTLYIIYAIKKRWI